MTVENSNYNIDNPEDIDLLSYRYGFSVAGNNILHDTNIPSQYSKLADLYRLPHSLPWFCGIINQHNAIVPIYDISGQFKSGQSLLKNNNNRHILTFDFKGEVVGLLIDNEPKIITGELNFVSSDNTKVPKTFSTACNGIYEDNEKTWIEFSFHKLFLILASLNN